MKLKIQFAILCDMIRREDSGKLILIGIYDRNIGLRKLPASIRIAMLVRAIATETGECEMEFRCLAGGEEIARGNGTIAVQDTGPLFLPFPSLPLNIEKPALLEFQWRLPPEEAWETIASIPADSPTAGASANAP